MEVMMNRSFIGLSVLAVVFFLSGCASIPEGASAVGNFEKGKMAGSNRQGKNLR